MNSSHLLLVATLVGCYVTAPPLTAGLPVPFTAGVMGDETRLLSSKRDSTSLEDTLIYLGVNKTFNVCFLKLWFIKYWTVIEVELMNWRCDHHSSNRNLSSCEF